MSSGIVLSTLLSDHLWHAQQMLSFGPVQLATRMTVVRLRGIYKRLGMFRTMKLAVKDRGALAQSVEPLLSLPVERIVLAHDQVIAQDAQSALRAAFAWILPG